MKENCIHSKSAFVEDSYTIDKKVGRPVKALALKCETCEEVIFVDKRDFEFTTTDGINYTRLKFSLDEG